MTSGVLITREPIVNKQRAITANRLIVHAPNIAAATDALANLAQHWPSQHTVFISLGKLVPNADLLGWQLPQNTLVEIPAPALQYPQTQTLVTQLHEAGVPLALSWYAPGAQWPAGADCRFVLADFNKHSQPVGAPGMAMAWGLKDLAGFKLALAGGYDGAAGWFFLQPQAATKELGASHAHIARVLNLVRQNAEVKEIEAALKQDVTLSYKLLRYINSAGFGLMVEVQSFRHAVTILGMDKLNKWLSVLMLSASKDPAAPAVMQAAIARGRFMELLGAQFVQKHEIDNLFITGAFSLLDVLLGTKLDAALEQMNLPEAINDALLYNQGAYAPLLKLAIATEGFMPDALRAQSEALGLPAEDVSSALIQAVSFADNLAYGG